MTFLLNDPATFAAQAAKGFALAHEDVVHAVSGGVVRTTRSADDQVVIVIGGGSGHYPAFAGLVGPGLAHGAVLGNIFASPSAHQVESVSRAVEQGKGVLLTYGNYAGDKLQFDSAAESLEGDGIPVRTVRVTDDIYSAPADERDKRRGIAGDLCVFKVAGAAASAGYDLDEVYEVTKRANENTFSLGVAFSGCTLPGADKPLFEVPKGKMAVGLGIHGEPGLDETDVPTPEGLADLLVSKLLDEANVKVEGQRVVVVINGLGAFKNDEMFVLYSFVREKLEAKGVVIADSKVGEFCTSFEMAGVSLTLFWLDEELEKLWLAPAQSPAYSVGEASADLIGVDESSYDKANLDLSDVPEASAESKQFAVVIGEALTQVASTVDENAEELGRIDSIAGDGDHGIGMQNGSHSAMTAAQQAVEAGAGAGTTLRWAGDAWQDGAGGTSGALWGAMLRALSETFGDEESFNCQSLRDGVKSALDAITKQGGAKVGDKTMVDAISPFVETLVNDSGEIAESWKAAVKAAQEGAEATKDMLPGLGRARSHGEKALGVPDPGAVSFAMIVDDLARVFEKN